MPADSDQETTRTFRPVSGPVSLVLCTLLALFLLGDALMRSGWAQMLILAPWVLLGLWAVYELAFVSAVKVDRDGVLVQNMLRRTSFGWARVRDVDLRWQVVFSLDDGTDVTSYGGPARARPRRSAGGDDEQRVPVALRDLTDIRDRWQAAADTADAPVRRGWDRAALLALAVISLWAIAATLIANAG